MKHCSELLQVYCNFAKIVETQFSKRIKIFRSDNALKYTQYAFQAILHSYGTIHQLTCLGTSQQNGRDERTCQWLCYNVEKGYCRNFKITFHRIKFYACKPTINHCLN